MRSASGPAERAAGNAFLHPAFCGPSRRMHAEPPRAGVAAALLALLLGGCDDAPGQWSALVYPDAGDRAHYQTTHRFKSLAMCRQAALETIAALSQPKKAAYECGFQCEADPASPGRNVCKGVTK